MWLANYTNVKRQIEETFIIHIMHRKKFFFAQKINIYKSLRKRNNSVENWAKEWTDIS